MMMWQEPVGVIERWQPQLDAIAPRSDEGLSYLRMFWEPGDSWAPVHRWMVWEMMPAHRAPLGIEKQLKGPNPRNFGHYDALLKRFIRTRSFMVNRRQWEAYQETGFYGRPIWIVQGTKGGHKKAWSQIESNISKMNGGPEEPPLPGELCYAEPDERTISKLQGLNMVRKFGDLLKLYTHDGALRQRLDFRERLQLEEMARQVWGWMDERAGDALTLTRAQASLIREHSDPNAPEPDEDEGYEDFVTSVVHNNSAS